MAVFIEIDKGNPFTKERYNMSLSQDSGFLPLGRMRQKRDDKGRLVEIPHALKIDPLG